MSALEPRVQFEGRVVRDVPCAVLFLCMFVVSLGSSFYVISATNLTINPRECSNVVTGTDENGIECTSESPCYVCTSETIIFTDSLQKDFDECSGTGRRLQAEDMTQDAEIWKILEMYPQIPSILIITVLVMGVFWIALLQKFSKPVVWATAIIKVVLWFAVGIWMYSLDVTETAVLCILMGVVYAIIIIWQRKKITKAAEFLSIACRALREEPGAFGAAAIIKVAYLIFLTLYCVTVIDSWFIWEVTDDCVFQPVPWVHKMITFQTFCLMWVTYFVKGARTNVTAMSVASWYFDQNPRPKNPAMVALRSTFTTSAGTIAMGSLICAIVERLLATARSKLWWTSPWGCFLKCLMCVLQTLVETLTKFTLITHAISGAAFFTAAKTTFGIMKRNFVGAVVTDQVGTSVLRLGAYVFSVAIGFAAWAWVDDLQGWNTLQPGGWDMDAVFYIFLVFYVYLTMYPLPTIFLVAIISSFMTGELSAPLTAIFCSAITHIVLGFIADFILDAMDTVFLCYAIGKEANLKVEGRESIYMLLDDMPEAKLLNNAQPAGVMVVDPQQTMQVQVPAGVSPGMTFRVDCGNGSLVDVTCPAGCGPGSMISVSVPAPTPQVAIAVPAAAPAVQPVAPNFSTKL